MEGLIQDLLNYARTGQREVLAVRVSLEPFLQEIENTFQARIKEGGVQFEIVRPLADLLGDPMLIKQILTNLIDNALTYRTRQGRPRISVASMVVDDRAVLSVRDNGIGIAPEYHEKIFQVFQRLHTDSEYVGTGIGLAIVAKAARLMNGTARVSSAPGEGSTFYVSLPRPRPDL
jgi:signal transduction histidine kinase